MSTTATASTTETSRVNPLVSENIAAMDAVERFIPTIESNEALVEFTRGRHLQEVNALGSVDDYWNFRGKRNLPPQLRQWLGTCTVLVDEIYTHQDCSNVLTRAWTTRGLSPELISGPRPAHQFYLLQIYEEPRPATLAGNRLEAWICVQTDDRVAAKALHDFAAQQSEAGRTIPEVTSDVLALAHKIEVEVRPYFQNKWLK